MKKIRIGHIGIAHDHAAPVLQCVLRYPEIFEFIGYAEENPANFAKKIVTDRQATARCEESDSRVDKISSVSGIFCRT